MRESFLHFIWQFQKFNTLHLKTTEGISVTIFSLGQYNTDAGPDFINAKVLIDDIIWYGHVEIHLKSSDWNLHAHQNDDAYNNVILHVVWTHDRSVFRVSGREIPTIELEERIPPHLIKRCNELLKSPEKIPCQSLIHHVKEIDKISTLEQIGVYRLEKKSQGILDLLDKNKGSWEETAYQVLAKNFGFKTNEEPFAKLSGTLPFKILVKHSASIKQLEALLFGISGFLPGSSDELYLSELINEFHFLQKKYALSNQGLLKVEWKFLRMRPGNFPTVRLSQFATFLSNNVNFFQSFINFTTVADIKGMFSMEPSEYWSSHYDFGKSSKRKFKGIGKESIDVLIINTVAPLLAAYAIQTKNTAFMEKAVDLLMSLKSEKNKIIHEWAELGVDSKNAFDSQALIGLRNDFCLKNQCLSCKIGVNLINR